MPFKGANHIVMKDTSELRLVSLVPSITELLCHLGFENNIVGCTKFCIHPASLKTTSRNVGGTKNPRIDDILDLKPDLVFTNKEENRKEDVELLAKNLDVHVSNINNVQDFQSFVSEIGVLLVIQSECNAFNARLQEMLSSLKDNLTGSVMYFIWKKPYMSVGVDTYIHSVLEHCGFTNVIQKTRYPEIDLNEINRLNPDYIFLSSEPYPFGKVDIQEMKAHTKAVVKLVDGELFSWYSNRIFHIQSHLSALQLT